MYDPRPMYPNMYHPVCRDKNRHFKGKAKRFTRTARPVRYYYIDFGLSRRYNPEDGPPREHPIVGGDKTVPEFQKWNGELLDPFPTDIYYIGNMIRTSILHVRALCSSRPRIHLTDDPAEIQRSRVLGTARQGHDTDRSVEETDDPGSRSSFRGVIERS